MNLIKLASIFPFTWKYLGYLYDFTEANDVFGIFGAKALD